MQNIILRPPNPDDYKNLFYWFNDIEDTYLWTDERTTYSFDVFVEIFNNRQKHHYHLFFMLESEGKVIGFTYTYRANQVDGCVFLCLFLAPKYRNNMLGSVAGYKIANYLFTESNFRKIYCEVFEYNHASKKILQKNGFELEGCLKSHRLHNNKYWDLNIFTLTKEKFLELPQI